MIFANHGICSKIVVQMEMNMPNNTNINKNTWLLLFYYTKTMVNFCKGNFKNNGRAVS